MFKTIAILAATMVTAAEPSNSMLRTGSNVIPTEAADHASAESPADISYVKHHDHPLCLHSCHALDFVSCSNPDQDNTCTTTRDPTCDEVSAVNTGCGKGCPKEMKDLMHKLACNSAPIAPTTLLLETKVVEQVGWGAFAKFFRI